MSVPLAFIGIILIWSTTPLAIKWSTLGSSFGFALFARMLIGVLLCALLLMCMRVPFPLHRRARLAYMVSGGSMFSAMALTYWSAQFVSSGLISVLFGLTPLLTSVGAVWLLKEALTPAKLGGMLCGLLGLWLIFYGSLDVGMGWGVATLLAAVVLQSGGLVWLKHIGDDSSPVATTLGALLVALPLFGAVWWISDGHIPADLSQQAICSIVYLGVFGSVLGFVLYYFLIKHTQAGHVALINLITPVFALLLGHLLNQEAILLQVWLGAACVILGLALHRLKG